MSMQEWALPALVVFSGFAFYIALALRNTRRMVAQTSARRQNPTQEQFVAMLDGEVSKETAAFLWERLTFLIGPHLTPHPDDDLANDLPIDPDEPTMDWLPEFAELHGRNHRDWPEWPQNWQGTVRNFARWLEMGLVN